MSDNLRIVDAPELPYEELTDDVKIPTGGKGNYSVKTKDLVNYTVETKDLANKSDVQTSSNGVKAIIEAHKSDKSNPHGVTKDQIGLGNVNNTADLDKPVSSATQAAIISANQGKADKTYVDIELGKKANSQDVTNSLNTKEDKTVVTNLRKLGGVDYWDGGTYPLNGEVRLDNGDIVKSIVSDNTKNPNNDMIGWVNISKIGKLVDTRLYGLQVNTDEDQTAAIHAAFADNPNNQQFYIPKGTIKANVVFPRAYIKLVGDGLLNTIIEPFDLTKSVVSFNKRLYSGMYDISVQAGQDFVGVSLLDATDVRYMELINYDTRKTIKAGEVHKYETILIDNRALTTSWVGYNKLRNVRAVYGAYGYLSDVDKLNSVLLMDGCLFSFNGYFNIKTSASNSTLINMDVANGGKLQPAGTYDETQYGGIYLKGDNTVLLGLWHELNAQSANSYNSNNLYIHPDSYNITHNFARDTRGKNNVRTYTQSQGQLQNVNTADQSMDDGQGRSRTRQLIRNGSFKHWDTATSRPRAWSGYYSGVWTQETNELPKGYDFGLKVVSNVAGACGIYQHIYNPNDLTNSYIKDITKWVGREITVSFWVKNIGTSASAIRGGISTDSSNVYFSSGNYTASTTIGEFVKIVAHHKITGTEPRIAVGCRVAGVNEGMIVAGFSSADDIRVTDAQPFSITEDGGEIFGNLEVREGLTINGVPPVFRPATVTTTGLTNASGQINAVDKFAGKQVFNNTDSLMYYSTGATPTSAWKSVDSTKTITPV